MTQCLGSVGDSLDFHFFLYNFFLPSFRFSEVKIRDSSLKRSLRHVNSGKKSKPTTQHFGVEQGPNCHAITLNRVCPEVCSPQAERAQQTV